MAFGGESADSYYDEGITSSMKGDIPRAVECFEKAIHLDFSYIAAIHQLGRCYLRMGQNHKAVELLTRAVAKRPEQVPARLDLGYAMLAVGRTQEARRCFEYIIELEPDNPRGMVGLAHTCFHEANWLGAARQAQAALQNGTPNFATLFILGRASKLAGDHVTSDEALNRADSLIEKSTELHPDDPEGYYLRGEVAFVREDFANAIDRFRAAETRTAKDKYYYAFGESFTLVDVLAKQALSYQRLGAIDKARALGIEIVRMDPEHRIGNALKNL
jgi:tetratricopeptide (TPR) repeat protein